MIIDHAALIIQDTDQGQALAFWDVNFYFTGRIIGRIALPIFAFLIVVGMENTSSRSEYLKRLFLLAVITDLLQYALEGEYVGNVISGFFLGALFIFFIEKKGWLKFLAIIPIAYTILCEFDFFPFFIDYGYYSVGLIILFYLTAKLTMYLKNRKEMSEERGMVLRNVLSFITFAIYAVILFFIPGAHANGQHIFAVIGGLFIIFYNYQRGYNKAWFKYGCYAFFPVHAAIIYAIYHLIAGYPII